MLLADLAPDTEFVEAHSIAAALSVTASENVDVVLLDLHLPGVRGLEGLERIRERFDSSRVVVLSGEENLQQIRAVIEAGAAGFIPKNSTPAVMLAALRLALAGGVYLPPHVISGTRADVPGSEIAPALPLTDRQREALQLAIQGRANKQIARALDLSEATVKAHLSAAFRTLGVHNRTEAVFAAARLGLKP